MQRRAYCCKKANTSCCRMMGGLSFEKLQMLPAGMLNHCQLLRVKKLFELPCGGAPAASSACLQCGGRYNWLAAMQLNDWAKGRQTTLGHDGLLTWHCASSWRQATDKLHRRLKSAARTLSSCARPLRESLLAVPPQFMQQAEANFRVRGPQWDTHSGVNFI